MRILIAWLFISTLAAAQTALDDTTPKLGLVLIDSADGVKLWKQANMPARMAPKRGLLIADVFPGSAAARIGLQQMDLLDKVGNRSVRTMEQVEAAMKTYKVNELVPITVRRVSGNAWLPTEGKILCSSPRMVAYSQLKSSYSAAKQTGRAWHCNFEGKKTFVAPIIGIAGNKPSLMLQIRYQSDDWIFMQAMTINIDGKTVEAKIPSLQVNREVLGAGEIQETETIAIPDGLKEMIVSNSSKRILRIDGKDYYREFELDEQWQRDVTAVVAVYEDMVATGNVDVTLGGRIPALK